MHPNHVTTAAATAADLAALSIETSLTTEERSKVDRAWLALGGSPMFSGGVALLPFQVYVAFSVAAAAGVAPMSYVPHTIL